VGAWTILGFAGYEIDDDDDEEEEEEDYPTTMQIVSVGLGRTGTTSLAVALEQLGYGVIHDDEHLELHDLYDSREKGEITNLEFHDLVAKQGYNATFKTDYRWALENIPDVKIIVTVRDNADKYVDSWLKAAEFVCTWIEITCVASISMILSESSEPFRKIAC